MHEAIAQEPHAARGTESERAATFRRLADERLHASYRLANAILGSPHEAQDAVHDAVVTAWQRWPSLRDRSRFDAWFSRIVVNTCRNHLKRSKRRTVVELDKSPEAPTVDPTGDVHDREQLERGLTRLTADDRIVLALRYYRDLTVEDIAELLDVPAGTVKSRLNRAHERLRRALAADAPGEARR